MFVGICFRSYAAACIGYAVASTIYDVRLWGIARQVAVAFGSSFYALSLLAALYPGTCCEV